MYFTFKALTIDLFSWLFLLSRVLFFAWIWSEIRQSETFLSFICGIKSVDNFTSLHAFHVFTDNKMEPLVNYGVKWFVWKVCFYILKSIFSISFLCLRTIVTEFTRISGAISHKTESLQNCLQWNGTQTKTKSGLKICKMCKYFHLEVLLVVLTIFMQKK